ncbi:MAG: hypothetical protein U9N33_04090 [Campylobacterota bacterium]|nr:hypothetical protein [Campylobacterota bacterium]
MGAATFSEFKKSQTQSFVKYKDDRDNSFSDYLKQQWNSFDIYKGVPLYENPKPRDIIQTNPKKIKSVGPKVGIIIKDVNATKVDRIKIKAVSTFDINFDFYGSTLVFNVPDNIDKAKFYPQNQNGIRNFFDATASSEYEPFIKKIKKITKRMNLNDWGVYLLVIEFSKHIHSNPDNANLLSWFIFNKLGYAVRVGLVQRHIVLMHYSEKIIYSTPSYLFSNKNFYVVSQYAKHSINRVYSYEQNYPDADKPLNLSLKGIPNFEPDIRKKTLTFKEYGKNYEVSFEYNQNLIDFMATYPQADYETFFNAPLDSITYKTVAIALKKHIDGMKMGDAINFVLHFVQKAFKYEVDSDQFSREKVMFANETLYFDKSDCEDRAVLFALLVEKLFGIGAVGVKYSDHMSTAINIPIAGDRVEVGSRALIAADPTYINANIGQSMAKYKNIKPDSFIFIRMD